MDIVDFTSLFDFCLVSISSVIGAAAPVKKEPDLEKMSEPPPMQPAPTHPLPIPQEKKPEEKPIPTLTHINATKKKNTQVPLQIPTLGPAAQAITPTSKPKTPNSATPTQSNTNPFSRGLPNISSGVTPANLLKSNTNNNPSINGKDNKLSFGMVDDSLIASTITTPKTG